MSVDGRVAVGPDMTMFDPNPLVSVLPDESSLWDRISQAIEAEWHPGGAIFGSGTFIRENDPVKDLPVFTGDTEILYEDYLPVDVVAKTQYWSVFIDGRGRGRSGYKGEPLGNHVIHVVSESAPAEYMAFLRSKQIPYLVGGRDHADLHAALSKLRSKLGVRVVCLMGGGTLNGVMIRERLVDEIHLVILPALYGGRQTPTLVDCDVLTSGSALPVLELLSTQSEQNGLLWLHYRVHYKTLET